MPLVQRLFFIWKFFSFFWERFGNLDFFFFEFFFFVLNIYTQTKLIRCYMKFLNSKKHRNKTLSLTMMLQTKCGVRQSWATCFFLVHLGCLRLGVIEPWLWWNGLGLHLKGLNHMIIWYLLEMAWPYTWKACILWIFSLWCCSCLYTFDELKCSRNNFGFLYQVEFNHSLWTWVHS